MFNFEDLTPKTRDFMIEAIEEAEQNEEIYYSTRFNEEGKKQWLPLLKKAAEKHNEHWLAFQLEDRGLMKDLEGSRTPSGGYTIKHVPHNATLTLSEGQFNRFYMLGLCKRAKVENISHLIVYRAKERRSPRRQSQSLIGKDIPIEDVEAQLKEIKNSFRSSLVKPNSGISLKLP